MTISIETYRLRIENFEKCSFVLDQPKKQDLLKPSFLQNSYLIVFLFCFGLVYSSNLNVLPQCITTVGSSSILSFEPWKNIGYKVDVNFLARYCYGNKSRSGIKIMHWNAEGGFLQSKKGDIENIVAKFKPHVFGISESLFKKEHDLNDIRIPDYEVHLSKTLENENLKVSRLAVYT